MPDDLNPPASPPPMAHIAPTAHVFYANARTYRNFRAVFFVLLFLALAAACIRGIVLLLLAGKPVTYVSWIFAAAVSVLAGAGAFKVISGQKDLIEISTAGIRM